MTEPHDAATGGERASPAAAVSVTSTCVIPAPLLKLMQREYGFLGTLALFICILYTPLVVDAPILARDDRTMLNVLREVASTGYVEAVWQGRALDVQPLRDLSLWFDMKLASALGFPVYHATQIIIWLGCGAVVHAILRTLGATPLIRMGLTALFLLHPVSISSVAWMAARKHLLACLFLSCATLRVVRWQRAITLPVIEAVFVTLLYAAAMASQPLGICWPLWAAWFIRTRVPAAPKRIYKVMAGIMGPVALFTAWINHRYYETFYPLRHGSTKVVDAELSAHFLAFGRYLTQLVAPVSLSTTEYVARSALNTWGLAGSIIVAALLLRRDPHHARGAWLGLYALALAPVTVQMTNIFGSDTYALVPLLAWVCLLGDPVCGLLVRVEAKSVRILALGLCATALLYATLIFVHIDDWRSDANFWRASYQAEPTAENMTQVALLDLQNSNIDEALTLAQAAYALAPQQRNLHLVLPEAIYLNYHLQSWEKLAMLRELQVRSVWPMYYGALIYAQRGEFQQAWTLMQRVTSTPAQFGPRAEEAVARATQLCQRAKVENCAILEEIAAQSIQGRAWERDKFDAVLATTPPWSAASADGRSEAP